MTLPSSGVISIRDIATEFSGPEPFALTDYYRGGGLVPNTPANSGVPSTGTIAVTDFYGASAGGGAINSYLLITNEDVPYLNKWNIPGFDGYEELLYPPSTIFFSADGAKGAYKTVLGGQVTPYWKLLDGSLADITPGGIVLPNRSFCVKISSDGNWVAAAHHQTSPYVTLIDLVNNTTTTPTPAPGTVRPDSNSRMAMTRDGSLLAIAGGNLAPFMIVYDLPGMTPVSPGPTAPGIIVSLAFSEDGQRLFAASNGSELSIYDTSDWSLIDTITYSGTWGYISAMEHSADNGVIVFGTVNGDVGTLSDVDYSVVFVDSNDAGGGNGTTAVSVSHDQSMAVATHNFAPYAVVFDFPGFVRNVFEPGVDAELSFADVGVFIPKA